MDIRINTNWDVLHGGDINEAVQVKYLDEQEKDGSQLAEMYSEEKTIILNSEKLSNCELNINVKPTAKLHQIGLLLSCYKLETSIGPLHEYHAIHYGTKIDDFEGIQIFRHQIKFENDPSINILTLNLIAPNPDIWIFKINLILQKNTDFLMNLLKQPSKLPPTRPPPSSAMSSINLNNVENYLKNSKIELSPNALKCKSFVESFPKCPSNVFMGMGIMSGSGSAVGGEGEKDINSNLGNENLIGVGLMMKNLIDQHFTMLEKKIEQKFNQFETKQNEKYDKILLMLEKLTEKLN